MTAYKLFFKLGCAIQVPLMNKDQAFGDANAGLYVLRNNTSEIDLPYLKQTVLAPLKTSPKSSSTSIVESSCP